MIWNSRVDFLCLPGLLCSALLWSPLNESLDKSHLIILINEISRPNSLHTDRVNPRGESAQDNDFFYLYLFFFVSFLSIQLRITKRWVFEEVQLQQETVERSEQDLDGWMDYMALSIMFKKWESTKHEWNVCILFNGMLNYKISFVSSSAKSCSCSSRMDLWKISGRSLKLFETALKLCYNGICEKSN